MIAFDALAGWQLKAACIAIMVGILGSGVGLLWLSKGAVEKDRGQIIGWADATCAAVGKPYHLGASDKPLARKLWGKDCLAEIIRLAAERAGAAQAALTTYTTHDTEQTAKAATDRPAARRSTARIASGQQQMETAIVTSPDGQLGPDYFDGLNRSLGLRPYIAAGSGSSGSGDAEGEAVERPAGVQ